MEDTSKQAGNKQIKIKRSSINFVQIGGGGSNSSNGVSPASANRLPIM